MKNSRKLTLVRGVSRPYVPRTLADRIRPKDKKKDEDNCYGAMLLF